MRGVFQSVVPWVLVRALLGVVTCIAVAWGLAAWLPHRGLAYRHNVISQEGVSGTRRTLLFVSVFQFSRPGMVRLAWRPGIPVVATGASGSQLVNDLHAEASLALKLPTLRQDRSWGELPRVLEGDFAKAGSGGEDARGWPRLAMWCQIDEASPSGYVSRGGIAISGAATSVGAARVLPCRPIWKGVFMDSGVYGVAWGVGIAGFVRARRVARRRRGWCPACGYDVRGGGECSECGWRGTAKGERRE